MAKGGTFEWKIIRKVGLWLFDREDAFVRTPGSGAMATKRKKGGKDTYDSHGDMAANIDDAKLFTEYFLSEFKKGYTNTGRIDKGKLLAACENSKGVLCAVNKVFKSSKRSSGKIDVLDFIDGKMNDPLLIKWWKKAEAEKEKFGKKAVFFVFERDRKSACVMLDENDFDLLESNLKPWAGCILKMRGGGYTLVIVLLEDFLNWCNPGTIKQLIKGEIKMAKGHVYNFFIVKVVEDEIKEVIGKGFKIGISEEKVRKLLIAEFAQDILRIEAEGDDTLILISPF